MLLSEIESLRAEMASILAQKDLLMKSQISGTGMSSNNLLDQQEGLSSARSHQPEVRSPSPRHRYSGDFANKGLENVELALQPLLEKITDPSEELYF